MAVTKKDVIDGLMNMAWMASVIVLVAEAGKVLGAPLATLLGLVVVAHEFLRRRK